MMMMMRVQAAAVVLMVCYDFGDVVRFGQSLDL